ncbi:MAG TPA: TetR/AcrR family transcriptional regulator [Opitutaceae bacterium]
MTIGRPREFDTDKALAVATQVFWHQGYEATSLDHLLRAMDLSKSSFYAAFGSRDRLFRTCVQHYCDQMLREMGKALVEAPSGMQFIRDVFARVIDEARSGAPHGCLLMNSATELGQRHPEFAEDIRGGIKRFQQVFRQALIRAQSEGDIPAEADITGLADYLTSSLGGVRTMTKAGVGPKAVGAIIKNILHFAE